jgi:Lon protease-like protein
VLFSTLLAGSEGIDDGLINPEKTWTGTRRFGLSFFDPQSQGLASVGTILEIKAHTLLDDGRILIDNLGRERYKILEVVEERPVLVCKIQYLDSTLEEEDKKKGDNNNSDEEEKELAVKAAELFKSVVQLSIKLRDSPLPSEVADPSQLRELSPRDLSFWMASLIAGNPYQQQALLEEETTMDRLKAVVDLMESTLKYLSAQSALQSAFKSTGDDTSSDAPGGGPD